MVYMGRWSDSGGAIVPAVAGIWVFVVRTTSMSVAAVMLVLYRVGVVIVVWRLFSSMKYVKLQAGVSLSRSILMSPTMVTVVCGLLLVMFSIAACISLMKFATFPRGLLYVLMIVCSGCVLVSSL